MFSQFRLVESEFYTRYIRALLLALFLCLGMGAGLVIASDDSSADSSASTGVLPDPIGKSRFTKLPPPRAGYTWQYVDSIHAHFSLPEGWHFLPIEFAGMREYFFTKENLEEQGIYRTGLSVEVITEASKKLGQTADRYAFHHIAQMVSSGDTMMTWGPTMEPYRNYGCRTRVLGPDSTEMILLSQVIGNSATETVYIMEFMLPVADWDEMEAIATTMVQYFILDDSF
jgi:hypothetical protein